MTIYTCSELLTIVGELVATTDTVLTDIKATGSIPRGHAQAFRRARAAAVEALAVEMAAAKYQVHHKIA